MEIYFDNSATTRIDSDVLKTMIDYSDRLYANPSAMHHFGFIVEQDVKNATEYTASVLGADKSEIIWTSGASESNNLAIKGYIKANKRIGHHIITTNIEHPSVRKVFDELKEEGYEVTYLNVDNNGQVDLEELKKVIRDDTIFVSIMYVNNEIGAVEDIDAIGKVIKEKNRNTKFHVDFVQGFGKYKIDVNKSNIDFLSVSSHKFYGPKGVGLLYKRKNIRLAPLILGGGQQNGLRAGTLNVPGIMGTMVATKKVYEDLDRNVEQLKKLRDYMIDSLDELNKKYNIITKNTQKNDKFAPHIVSVSFRGIRAEVLLHSLEEQGVYVSAGSACSSHNKKTSSTLIAIGLKNEIAESTIRISFGKYNTISEIDSFTRILDGIIPKLLIKY